MNVNNIGRGIASVKGINQTLRSRGLPTAMKQHLLAKESQKGLAN